MSVRYATIDAAGLATGFYADDHGALVPATAIEISEDVYRAWIGNTAGQAFHGGQLVPYNPPVQPLTLPQQAAQAIQSGCQIVSTGTPALNGTYTCTPEAQQKFASVSLFCVVNSTFPGGGTTYPWLDVNGNPHLFPSVADFQTFATAIANYVAALDFVLAGASQTLPAQPVTIA